jgi:CRISPR/Cas system-associated endonuclease Cas1
MMEEFRPLVAEYTCWRLLRHLGDTGWWTLENGAARLTDAARRALIEAIEGRLASQTVHAPTNSRVTLERAIELQVRDFAAVLEGSWGRYRPLRGA